jgi:hypothetical protein
MNSGDKLNPVYSPRSPAASRQEFGENDYKQGGRVHVDYLHALTISREDQHEPASGERPAALGPWTPPGASHGHFEFGGAPGSGDPAEPAVFHVANVEFQAAASRAANEAANAANGFERLPTEVMQDGEPAGNTALVIHAQGEQKMQPEHDAPAAQAVHAPMPRAARARRGRQAALLSLPRGLISPAIMRFLTYVEMVNLAGTHPHLQNEVASDRVFGLARPLTPHLMNVNALRFNNAMPPGSLDAARQATGDFREYEVENWTTSVLALLNFERPGSQQFCPEHHAWLLECDALEAQIQEWDRDPADDLTELLRKVGAPEPLQDELRELLARKPWPYVGFSCVVGQLLSQVRMHILCDALDNISTTLTGQAAEARQRPGAAQQQADNTFNPLMQLRAHRVNVHVLSSNPLGMARDRLEALHQAIYHYRNNIEEWGEAVLALVGPAANAGASLLPKHQGMLHQCDSWLALTDEDAARIPAHELEALMLRAHVPVKERTTVLHALEAAKGNLPGSENGADECEGDEGDEGDADLRQSLELVRECVLRDALDSISLMYTAGGGRPGHKRKRNDLDGQPASTAASSSLQRPLPQPWSRLDMLNRCGQWCTLAIVQPGAIPVDEVIEVMQRAGVSAREQGLMRDALKTVRSRDDVVGEDGFYIAELLRDTASMLRETAGSTSLQSATNPSVRPAGPSHSRAYRAPGAPQA